MARGGVEMTEKRSPYPGMMHLTFNEAYEFADRVVRALGIDRRDFGIRDFDFGNRVAAVYHEMTRLPVKEDEHMN